jgi:RNA polymerase sigma-70 factor, ECF subfamily
VPVKAHPAQADPAQADPAQADPAEADPAEADPAEADFATLTDPYRHELLAYCYRMLGSVDDAEDQLQETLLRAWRSYQEFEGRSSLRTWLYRIATNSCLRALETRSRRPLPSGLGAPAPDPGHPLPAGQPEVPWLQPFPDMLITGSEPADPASIVTSRATMRLALIAALQYLPARQRAVLILRDVLGWHAAEVSGLLGISTAAANSILQRARARLEQVAPAEDDMREPAEAADRTLLDRYAAAFETADVEALTELLRQDASLEMPPQPYWFAGRDVVARFLRMVVLTGPGKFMLVPVTANGQPGFAAYARADDGSFQAHAIQVLTIKAGQIARIVSFNDGGLLAAFGLPLEPAARPELAACRE